MNFRVLLILLLFFQAGFVFSQVSHANKPAHYDQRELQSYFTAFEENKGQVCDQYGNTRQDVLFTGIAGGLVYHVRADGISYQLTRFEESEERPAQTLFSKQVHSNDTFPYQELTIYRVDMNWLNMHNSPEVVKGEVLPGYNNYYNVPAGVDPALYVRTYQELTFRNVWEGIDLHYYIRDGILESDWLVERAEDYRKIAFEIEGAELKVDAEGYLVMNTPLGEIREGKLAVYQNNELLQSEWILHDNRVSFKIEDYKNDQPLVIDPPVRIWGTTYGGNYNDVTNSIAVDAKGDVYMTGGTQSTMNIATTGAHQTTHGNPSIPPTNSSWDMFLVKFNSDGVRQWGTYYGGSRYDVGNCVCVDMSVESGDVYVTGRTFSTNNIATPGAHEDSMRLDNSDNKGAAFLVKFNPNGFRQWGTYYGSPGCIGNSCAVDGFGDVYLAGTAGPIGDVATEGAHQTTYGGAFLAKFSPYGGRLWSTYYGLETYGHSCAVDGDGNVFLAGETWDLHYNTWPHAIATPGAHQKSYAGFGDFFLVKFNPNGVRQWGTYYGGAHEERNPFVATDGTGNVFLSGLTGSSTHIATPGAHRSTSPPSLGFTHDHFITKFDSTGVRLWGTYFAYRGSLSANHHFCVNEFGDVLITGITKDTIGISTPGAYIEDPHTIYGGCFIAKFNNNGNQVWGSYVKCARVCATDNFGNFYIEGSGGVQTPGAHQMSCPGGSCTGLAKFTECENYLVITDQPQNLQLVENDNALFTISSLGDSTTFQWQSNFGNGFIDLTDTGQYVGVTTDSLIILNVTQNNNQQPFRCIVKSKNCIDTSNIAVLLVTTGIKNISAQNSQFSIYPNPAKDQITIKVNNFVTNARYSLFNILGKKILSGEIVSQKTNVETSALSKGVYILKITSEKDQSLETLKVIIE